MKKQDHELNQKLMALAVPMAAAVMSRVKVDLPLDPEAADPNVQTANAMMFRLTRTFASWLAASEGNPSYWPPLPKLDDDQPTSGGGIIPPVPVAPQPATTTTTRTALKPDLTPLPPPGPYPIMAEVADDQDDEEKPPAVRQSGGMQAPAKRRR